MSTNRKTDVNVANDSNGLLALKDDHPRIEASYAAAVGKVVVRLSGVREEEPKVPPAVPSSGRIRDVFAP